MINIKFRGHKAVLNRLKKLGIGIEADTPTALESSANILRDGAITNLNSSVGGGRWGVWGTSADSIRDKTKWATTKTAKLGVKLECLSKHSEVVELGGMGKVYASQYGHKAWPIGRAQGREPIYRPYFTLQGGYHYTVRAMNDPSVKTAMRQDIAKILRGSIAKVCI